MIMLPISIVRIEKSFVFDDDYGDFQNDSILRYYRKDDQEKIKSIFLFLMKISNECLYF